MKILTFLSLVIFANQAIASNHDHQRPDGHAPIGVMRDHTHKKGEFMASYRFGYMKMRGLKSQNSAKNYMVKPTEMTMKMDMLSAMYGFTDKLTGAAMIGAVKKNMNHEHRVNGKFKRESKGVSDLKLNALYQFYADEKNKAQFNFGVSLPTGNIDEDYLGANLPYPMQIGSGSYEALPGFSFSHFAKNYSFGAQINASFKLNENKNNYKFGDSYNATTWIAKNFGQNLSLSTRLDYTKTEAVEGVDATLNPNMIATADGSLQDRQNLDVLFGANFIFLHGFLKGNRLALEYGKSIYQKIDGAMLKQDQRLVLGWQRVF